jgi:choline dehydrogenase-like flavoprotein
MTEKIDTDTLVIGSGPGGSVMADELQKAGKQVLIVEEGIAFNQRNFKPYSLSEMLSLYRHGGITTTFGTPPIKYVEGRCLGGGSEVNSGMYFRTPADIIRQWKDNYQVTNFSEESLNPHFNACEKRVNVCYLPGKHPLSSVKLLEGANSLGWECKEIPRWYKYSNKPDPSPIEGIRQSMSETYLSTFKENGGEIMTGITIDIIKKKGNSWTVTGYQNILGTPIKICASTVILSAGAIQTPVILRRSGYTKNVGNSLKVHSTAKVIAQFEEEINNELTGIPGHQIREFSPTQSFGCAVSSPAFLRVSLLDNPDFNEEIEDIWRHMASYYIMISGGIGSIRSYPLLRDPVIWYQLEQSNLVSLALGIKRLCKVMFRAGAEKVYPSIKGLHGLTHESQIHRIPNIVDRNTVNLMTIHLMGSCPMGEDKSKTAVDSYGQVHGASGLYVSDASLIGSILGVNPQGTVMAISRRNAHHILKL